MDNSDDFDGMCKLVSALNAEHLCDWSLGRMYGWKYGRWSEESQIDSQFEKQAELFFDSSDELRGIVITENFGHSYYILSAKDKELISAMVDFLLHGEKFNRSFVITIPENDIYQRSVLEEKGFGYCGDADTTYTYYASDIALREIKLPTGFTLTSQKEYLNEAAAELLRYYAFNPDGVYDDILDRAYKYARKNPILVPELTILVLNENGEPVSTCMGLWDIDNQSMEIETVATKKEYENRGLARVVISECIKRGVSKGVKEFSISAWEEKTRKLYSSFGKVQDNKKINYRRA